MELAGQYGVKKKFVRPRNRWKDNIKKEFKEIGWQDIVGINLVMTVSSSGL